MELSVFDIFRIGIGPSSSHTVGPMRASAMFINALKTNNLLDSTVRMRIELYGSLGATGKGHGTDKGVTLGLMGYTPETVASDAIDDTIELVKRMKKIRLADANSIIDFSLEKDIGFYRKSLGDHPNGIVFTASGIDGVLLKRTYFSVGGGFVVTQESEDSSASDDRVIPTFKFTTGAELLLLCEQENLNIADVMFAREKTWRSEDTIRQDILQLWDVMRACVERGLSAEGALPGPYAVKRRAAELVRKLAVVSESSSSQRCQDSTDWLNIFAMAVSEENASGGHIVTAPTNGAAGVIPAVLYHYMKFHRAATDDDAVSFILTAGAIGILYKINASISGAEVGCQGEVGVACSMAAAALCAVMGGSPEQVENAAEIGMEHNLGLTCDPVGGQVQIPCIERNAMGAVKAANAAKISLLGDGKHYVSLDAVIKTMMQTGSDMKNKYKETSRGGLAVNIVEC
ncbi:L-serine ammonia-lyase [Paraburkholderia sp.]|uniref:L-serine ammonia-lyase n=1 Tax=Paraburkholderia sp. TaxID=1926495 RepID=UPI0039E3FF46